MTAIDRLRTPPMIIGGIVAGLLLLVIVGIARSAGGVDVAGSIQNNAGAIVARPVEPQAQPVQVVQVVIVVTATPTRPAHWWLDAAVDVAGGWWIWADSAWVACSRISPDLNYNMTQSEPSYTAWYWLHANQRQAVYNRCLEVTQ